MLNSMITAWLLITMWRNSVGKSSSMHLLLDNISSTNRYPNGREIDGFCFSKRHYTCTCLHTPSKGLRDAYPTHHLADRVNKKVILTLYSFKPVAAGSVNPWKQLQGPVIISWLQWIWAQGVWCQGIIYRHTHISIWPSEKANFPNVKSKMYYESV